ncbi:MAG: 50S ribosomal protein L27 [Patescibacteria group bacterium]|nr:MAG: 50S ribosomal protein L27 [Patescibacteria group bacterium]
MSKKKQGGKAAQHVRPEGKRLGIKVSDSQKVEAGSVLVRQRGTKIKAGKGVKVGRDHTLYAIESGRVKFRNVEGKKEVYITEA